MTAPLGGQDGAHAARDHARRARGASRRPPAIRRRPLRGAHADPELLRDRAWPDFERDAEQIKQRLGEMDEMGVDWTIIGPPWSPAPGPVEWIQAFGTALSRIAEGRRIDALNLSELVRSRSERCAGPWRHFRGCGRSAVSTLKTGRLQAENPGGRLGDWPRTAQRHYGNARRHYPLGAPYEPALARTVCVRAGDHFRRRRPVPMR